MVKLRISMKLPENSNFGGLINLWSEGFCIIMVCFAEEDLIEKYLAGEIIDPCEYDALALEKFHEMIGDEEEDV